MLPITSSAASPIEGPQAASAARTAAAHEAAAHFEGLLFAGALAPLSKAIGVLGDVLSDAVATAVVRNSHDEFYERLAGLAAGEAGDGSDERP